MIPKITNMKNHLTIVGFSIAICAFLVAQGSTAHRPAPVKSTASYVVDQQDTSKHKMHKKWKKDKDSTMRKERDTTTPRIENR